MKVSRLQRALGFSDHELAARSGLDPDELEAVLRGEGKIAPEVLFLLAGALGVEPGDLLEGIAWVPDGEGGGEYRRADPGGS